jgi:thiol-disulfide isomerase/thioredoxin
VNAKSGQGRRRWLLAGVGAAAMASGLGWAWLRLQPQPVASAAVTALFEQTFNDAQGRPQALEQWRGQWLVVNFWATWCAPCVEEMPVLQKVAREYRDKGVAVIGLGIDTAVAIRRFQDELRLELPLLVAGATGSELARQLGNPSGALPYTVLVSPAGAVAQARLGLLSEALLRSWLDGRV